MKNILYIHTHDSGRVLSPYGYQVPTPHLKAFAKEAVLFRQAYCAGPTCSPSRAAMLTSLYPHQNGMLGLAQRGFSMDYKKHLVQYLNAKGYHTALCGIQHEAGWYLDCGDGAKQIGYQEELTKDNSGYRQEDLIDWDKENAGEVCRWLKKYNSEKPFFLSYGMYATHRRFPDRADNEVKAGYVLPPYPMPDSPETREDFTGYIKSVKSADTCFGQVINSLKEAGLWEDTIILFTTDHGLANPFAKCTLSDSGVGVALMLHTPGTGSHGIVTDNLVSHVDVFPTLCDLAGLEKPDYLEGVSFARTVLGEKEPTREAVFGEINFHTSYEPARFVRTSRYKYIRYYDTTYLDINQSNIDESLSKEYFVRHGLDRQHKYQEALYDLIYDPGERNNLSGRAEYEPVRKEMAEKLEEFQKKTADPLLDGPIAIKPGWKVNKKECRTASSRNPDDYVNTNWEEPIKMQESIKK